MVSYMNIIEIMEKYTTQKSCIEYLEAKRWQDKPICPYCKESNSYRMEAELRHKCRSCWRSFSVTVGTIFHHTYVDISKWFLLIGLMLNAKKGISACQAARDLNMNRPTVWRMMHRIRKAMKGEQAELLKGIVEMDETYIGGKPRKESKDKDDNGNYPRNPRGRGTKKECVVGMIERGGKVKAIKVDKDKLKSKDLQKMVVDNIDTKNTILITDEYKGYSRMSRLLKHSQVNHQKEYVSGKDIHTKQ